MLAAKANTRVGQKANVADRVQSVGLVSDRKFTFPANAYNHLL